MALACKCDRCGRFFDIQRNDNHAVQRVSKIITGNYPIEKSSAYGPINTEEFDLCEDCKNDFVLWMKYETNNKELEEAPLNVCDGCQFYEKDSSSCSISESPTIPADCKIYKEDK